MEYPALVATKYEEGAAKYILLHIGQQSVQGSWTPPFRVEPKCSFTDTELTRPRANKHPPQNGRLDFHHLVASPTASIRTLSAASASYNNMAMTSREVAKVRKLDRLHGLELHAGVKKFEDGRNSDLLITCGPREWRTHKFILSAMSPVLERSCFGGFKVCSFAVTRYEQFTNTWVVGKHGVSP